MARFKKKKGNKRHFKRKSRVLARKARAIKKVSKTFSKEKIAKIKKLRPEEIEILDNDSFDKFIENNDNSLISFFEKESITVLMNFLRKQANFDMITERVLCVSIYLFVRLIGFGHRESNKFLKIFNTYNSRTAWKWLKQIKEDGFEAILQNFRCIPKTSFFEEYPEVSVLYKKNLNVSIKNWKHLFKKDCSCSKNICT